MSTSLYQKWLRLGLGDRMLLGGAFAVMALALGVLLSYPIKLRPGQINKLVVGSLSTTTKVRRLSARDNRWVEIQKGDVHPGDFVATDNSNGAVIQFTNGSTVNLDPSSIVEIVALTENQYEVVIHRGRIASSPGLNVRQSDRFDLANLPDPSHSQLAMPMVPFTGNSPVR
jgi:hypothetical protein